MLYECAHVNESLYVLNEDIKKDKTINKGYYEVYSENIGKKYDDCSIIVTIMVFFFLVLLITRWLRCEWDVLILGRSSFLLKYQTKYSCFRAEEALILKPSYFEVWTEGPRLHRAQRPFLCQRKVKSASSEWETRRSRSFRGSDPAYWITAHKLFESIMFFVLLSSRRE